MKVVTIVGNLTRDPELRETKSGLSVCNFSVAVSNERRKDRDESATFFRVSAFGKRGEMVHEYMKKGSTVYVTGDIELQQYQGKDGEQYTDLVVTADRVKFGPKRDSDGEQQQQRRESRPRVENDFYSEAYG